MNFEEHAAKPLLRAAGIATPQGALVTTPGEARARAQALGACVVKAQVPTGKRGKAGGIALAGNAAEAEAAARRILGMEIDGLRVERLLIEEQVAIARELYAAVLNDAESKGPLVLFSPEGGMDIEELAAARPDALLRLPVDIRRGLDRNVLLERLPEVPGARREAVADVLLSLYAAYLEHDAELFEINPLVVAKDGRLVALDAKFVLDDSAVKRQAELAKKGAPARLTALEQRAREAGLNYIELDGDVGLLSNGAGLTMTTMDAIRHYGGRPANFLEIGGNAYVLGRQALAVVLANPRVRALLINFCGAIARTDVMTRGVLEAWDEVKPSVPVFWTIHGTGEEEAIALVKERLGVTPFDLMDDAVRAAVEAAK